MAMYKTKYRMDNYVQNERVCVCVCVCVCVRGGWVKE